MAKYTYVLYLSEENDNENMVFLGASDNPAKLYTNALNYKTAEEKTKEIVLKWLVNYHDHLTDREKKDMDHMFTTTPGNGGHYCIKGMTLTIKRMRQF
jgi:hypothetical protein